MCTGNLGVSNYDPMASMLKYCNHVPSVKQGRNLQRVFDATNAELRTAYRHESKSRRRQPTVARALRPALLSVPPAFWLRKQKSWLRPAIRHKARHGHQAWAPRGIAACFTQSIQHVVTATAPWMPASAAMQPLDHQIQASRSAPAHQSASFCQGLKLQQIIPMAVPDVLHVCRQLLHH